MHSATVSAFLEEFEKIAKGRAFKFVHGLVNPNRSGAYSKLSPISKSRPAAAEAVGAPQLRQMASGKSVTLRPGQASDPNRLARQIEKQHPLSQQKSVVGGERLSKSTADVMSREAQLEKLVAEGKFTKAHDIPHFNRTGEIKARAAKAAPSQVAQPGTAVIDQSAMVPRPGMAPQPHISKPAPSPAPSATPEQMTPGMRRILAAGGLGTAGAGGYGANAAVD